MNLARALLVASLVATAACAASTDSVTDDSEEAAIRRSPNLGPSPQGHATRYPILLVHGFTGSRKLWNFVGVPDALTRDGHVVQHAELPPFGTPDANAAVLAQQIDELLAKTGAKKVNLVAHSKGGLDARAVMKLGYGDRVASLTTIASPHRGTAIADAALELIPADADGAIDAITTLWTETLSRSDFESKNDLRAALADMSEAKSGSWNAAHPDDPRVFYQSWAGISNVAGIANPGEEDACEGKGYMRGTPRDVMDPKLVPVAAFVAHGLELRPNDGMATVESSKWGLFRGCIPADHQDDVGRPGHTGKDSRSGFDHVRFYRQIAFDLAARGF